jgi:hypothetical protein
MIRISATGKYHIPAYPGSSLCKRSLSKPFHVLPVGVKTRRVCVQCKKLANTMNGGVVGQFENM